MQKLKKLISKMALHYKCSCIGISSIAVSIYVFFHLNYLDDPRVTPVYLQKPDNFALIDGITDDGWFAALLMTMGLVMLYAILFDNYKVMKNAYSGITAIYVMVGVSFGIRGLLEPHFNITWLFTFLCIALLFSGHRKKGGNLNE